MKSREYFQINKTYVGFLEKNKPNLPDCAGKPVEITSPDGQKMAIYVKECSSTNTYHCLDSESKLAGVDATYYAKKYPFCIPK
jgi:hypothetical protein